jgi:hypothetical protein
MAGLAAAEGLEPLLVEGVLAPRRLVAEPPSPPADPLLVRLVWVDPARAALGAEAVARE